MREIKFRAWHRGEKKLFYPISLFNLLDKEVWINESHKKPINRLYGHVGIDIDLMQYTGLKDKNGVEIYEGDILKITPDRYSNYISLGYVEYDHDSARYRVTTGKGYDTRNAFDINCDADFEVIGNIYENPELLENNT